LLGGVIVSTLWRFYKGVCSGVRHLKRAKINADNANTVKAPAYAAPAYAFAA